MLEGGVGGSGFVGPAKPPEGDASITGVAGAGSGIGAAAGSGAAAGVGGSLIAGVAGSIGAGAGVSFRVGAAVGISLAIGLGVGALDASITGAVGAGGVDSIIAGLLLMTPVGGSEAIVDIGGVSGTLGGAGVVTSGATGSDGAGELTVGFGSAGLVGVVGFGSVGVVVGFVFCSSGI